MKSRILNSIIVLAIILAQIAIAPAFTNTHTTYADTGQRWTPGEYEPVYGVMVAWEPGTYLTLLTDFVTGVTSDPNTDTQAFVIVRDSIQEASAYSTLGAAGAYMDRVEFIYYDLDTVWIRDYGPKYIIDENGYLSIIDHNYNRPRPKDDALPGFISPYDLPFGETEPVELMDLVHGGGNFLCVSTGDAFMSSLVLEENSSKTEQEIKDIINTHFNVDVTIYEKLSTNVDATGHIDMWMMPLSDSKIIVSEFPANKYPLSKAITDAAAADLESRGYTVYRTPAENSTGEGTRGGTHYTYTNAAIVNNKVFIPDYGPSHKKENAVALTIYQTALPDHEIIQLDCRSIINADGAIHCAMQHVCVPELKLGFTTAGQTITAGQVSSAMTIQTQDAAGSPINVTSDTQIDLTSSSASGAFYRDAGGTVQIWDVTIATGTSSASFFYKDTLAGSPVIAAAESPPQGWADVTQRETVTYAALDHFTFDNISDQDKDAAFSITITTVDAYGNTVTSYTGSNSLSDGNGTINPTSTSAFTAGVWTGNVTITSPYTDVNITTSDGNQSGVSNVFTVTGGDVISKMVFTTAGQTISAGNVSSVMTIQAQDAAGNPINVTSDIQINLDSSSAGGTFFSDASGTIQIWDVTIATGSSSASFYYKDLLAGNPTITGAESPELSWTDATQGETITCAALDHFTFDNISDQDENVAFSITITALDAYGNTVISYNGTNSLSDGNGTITPTSTTAFTAGVWTGNVAIATSYASVNISTSVGGQSGVSNAFAVIAKDIKIEPGEIIPISFEIINSSYETSTITLQYQMPAELIIKSVSVKTNDTVKVIGNGLSAALGTQEAGSTATVDLTIEVSRNVIAETSLAGLLKSDYLVLDIKPVETVDAILSISNLIIESSEKKLYPLISFAERTGKQAEISVDVSSLKSEKGNYLVNIAANDILLHTIEGTSHLDAIETYEYDIDLTINGDVWETREVELESGETKKVVFYLENLDTGEYTVNIAGLEDDFVSSSSVNWWLTFTSVLTLVFIGYLIKTAAS